MKARIKKTGDIIDIFDFSEESLSNVIDSNGNHIKLTLEDITIPLNNLQSTSNIDWENRRYEIAKAAMQGILSNQEQVEYAGTVCGNINTLIVNDIAQYAIACADALIEELKKKD